MSTHIARRIKAGQWFWMNKTFIQHYASRIGFSAVGVYSFLASMTDEAQQCFPSQSYIARHLGCSRATVNRAIKVLAQSKLIFVEKRENQNHLYTLLEVQCNTNETDLLHKRNTLVQKCDTNKTYKQEINNDTVVSDSPMESKENLIASDIATALDDQYHREDYLAFARTYPESFLRRILSEVKRTPYHKIKKSRSALFKYLVHYYAHKNS